MDKNIIAWFSIVLLLLPATVLSDVIFSAPPRESAQKGIEHYKPIADFLTQALGEKVVYERPISWAGYSKKMREGYYDIVFDGPHFVSWRIANIDHKALIKLPQPHVWTVIARNDDLSINSLDDLVAKKFCAPGSPNFGTLTLLSHYPNPAQEPLQVTTKGWKNGFDSLIARKCYATVLPQTNHRKYDPVGTLTKVIHTHQPYPNQAFTAGPRIGDPVKLKIQQALLSEEGQTAMLKLRERFAAGEKLIPANNEEYDGISKVLDRAVGFGIFGF